MISKTYVQTHSLIDTTVVCVCAQAHACVIKRECNKAYLETLGQKLEGSLLHDQHAPRS